MTIFSLISAHSDKQGVKQIKLRSQNSNFINELRIKKHEIVNTLNKESNIITMYLHLHVSALIKLALKI